MWQEAAQVGSVLNDDPRGNLLYFLTCEDRKLQNRFAARGEQQRGTGVSGERRVRVKVNTASDTAHG